MTTAPGSMRLALIVPKERDHAARLVLQWEDGRPVTLPDGTPLELREDAIAELFAEEFAGTEFPWYRRASHEEVAKSAVAALRRAVYRFKELSTRAGEVKLV